MKKFISAIAITGTIAIGTSAYAGSFAFEDLIDTWEVNGATYDSVYIDQNASLLPNSVLSPFGYTHDLNQEVNFAGGELVTSAWLELDFTDMDVLEGFGGDTHGSVLGIQWDDREKVKYTYASASSSWIEISSDNDIQDVVLDIDWLNDDGFLAVSIALKNSTGTADLALDQSRVYGTAETAPVPEPSTILLMGAGLLGLVGYRKRSQKKS